MNNFCEDWIIFETVFGSFLYGTNTPDSDKDIRGVCVPPRKVLLDPFSNFEQQELEGDHIIYNLRKFIQLACDCNPNIIELFFAYGNFITKLEWKGLYLLENRGYFISQKARHTFAGYAESQLRRIQLHRKWLLNPPKKRPERSDFGLPAMPDDRIAGSKIELLHSLSSDNLDELIKPEILKLVKTEIAYSSANIQYNNYLTWQKERNPARAKLEEQFGYDTKHAMHLYRLLGECKELLMTGKITFPRPDHELLLEIKMGKYTYDEIIADAINLKVGIDSIPSILPEKPDLKEIQKIYYYLIGE